MVFCYSSHWKPKLMIHLWYLSKGLYFLGSQYSASSLVAQMVKCLPTMQETGVQSLGREGLLEKEMATHLSILAGKSHGCSLVGYSPWGRKESDTTERLHFHFPQGTSPANTLLFSLTRLILDPWPPETQDHKCVLFSSTKLVVISYSSNRKLIQ